MSVKNIQFPNGFRLVYEKSNSEIPLTSYHVFCNLGPGHETEKLKGASHFIEHMCFKGTKKIPESKEISLVYDKIGAYFNAFTEKRYTCYTVDCQSKYAFNCLNMLSDMVLNSIFDKKEYNKEHKVVIEENTDDLNDPLELAYNAINKELFDGSSFEKPIDHVDFHRKGHLKYEDVVDMYNHFYTQNNLILSVVSNLSLEQFQKFLPKTYFLKNSAQKNSISFNNLNFYVKPKSNISYVIEKKNGISNITLMIGFRVCGFHHEDKPILELLKVCLGKNMSGRLKYILREEKGLVYSAYIDDMYFEEIGGYTFVTQTDVKNLLGKNGVLNTVIDILRNLINKGITTEELRIVKGTIEGDNIIDLQTTSNRCLYNGETVLYNPEITSIIPYKHVYDKTFKHITKAQVDQVIKKYFTPENMSVCIVGQKVPSIQQIKNVCEKLF
tara:strand:+ start:2707 stop:4029 length:1323 start_codon:yes stop_codon:yes gene_type:complete